MPVHGTFRTPPDSVAQCTDAPPDTDCQNDWFFGDIGGADNGRPGAIDHLVTNYIDMRWGDAHGKPGFWKYQDFEDVVDNGRSVVRFRRFSGVEDGFIDARPGVSTTGNFTAVYRGTSRDGCSSLYFVISGKIDISGIVDQSSNPVNGDSGNWAGAITIRC